MDRETLEMLKNSMNVASIASGRNKEPDDYTILHEYMSRYNKKPSILRISHKPYEYFKYDSLLENLSKLSHEIIYTDQYYSAENDMILTQRNVFKLDDEYLCEVSIQIADDILEPEDYTKAELKKTDQLITDIRILTPTNPDEKITKKLINI